MIEPERNLWKAVIIQAVFDATAVTVRSKENSNSSTYLSQDERDYARRWLTENTSGFRSICWAAGVDADSVRRKALELAGKGWERPWGYNLRRHGTNCVDNPHFVS